MTTLRCAGKGVDGDLLFEIPLDRGSWLAEVSGRDTKFGMKRHFLKGPTQALRTVTITSGTLYEVSIYKKERYFFTLDRTGLMQPIDSQEARMFHKWEGEGRLVWGPAR
jgi:hypothetical protein